MLEILKEEDGVVYKRLSDRKILIEKYLDLFVCGTKVDEIKLKFRYKYYDNDIYLLMPLSKVINGISYKYSTKIKNISLNGKNHSVSINNKIIQFDNLIYSVLIDDVRLNRNFKLKSLLEI